LDTPHVWRGGYDALDEVKRKLRELGLEVEGSVRVEPVITDGSDRRDG
jgi:hypothetical protein